MKKTFIKMISTFAFLLILFSFLSCGSNQEIYDSNYYSIKNLISEIDDQTEWCDEIEGNLLAEKHNSVEGVSIKAELNPYSYILRQNNHKKEIYPYIPDFSSLDITLYPKESLEVLTSFSNGVLTGDVDESLYEPTKLYELKLFLYDLEKMYGSDIKVTNFVFGEPFISDAEEIFQCPIRFMEEGEGYKRQGFDISVYLVKKNGEYKIQQTAFIKKSM